MRRTTLRRLAAAAAAPTLLVASLTACGSDSDSGSDSGSDQAASDTSASVEEGEEVDKDDFLNDFRDGLEASTTAAITMNTELGATGAITAEGDADYTTDPPSLSMTMEMPAMGTGGAMEIRMVDGILYMNLGQMSNDKFMKLDLSDPKSLPPGMGALTEQMDPLAAIEQFEPALTSVTYVGEEDVDGDPTDHYELTMDTSKIEMFKDLPQGADVPEELTYDAWFDDEFRFRQLQMEMDAAGQAVTMEMQASDWGEPVDIKAPADSEIVEMPAGATAG
jgi:hypothetical protein